MMDQVLKMRKENIKDDCKAIVWRMNERKMKPSELSDKTGSSPEYIEKIINGTIESLKLDFVKKCAWAFNLEEIETRGDFFMDRGLKNYDYYMNLIKPPPGMPPRPGNFWEYNDD